MGQRGRFVGAIILPFVLLFNGSNFTARSATRVHAASTNSTLVYGSSTEPDTLNPLISGLQVTGDVDSAVFDTLINYDPHNKVIPVLATSVKHSADGRTWTFHLRHGVKWADGQPFTSADVAYTYSAIFNKKNNIVSTTGWDKIDKFSTPDDYTVVMHLKQIFAPFLSYIGPTFILPKHIYDQPGVNFNKTPFNRKPFGTGPYMVSEWKTGDHITLVANPNSWRGQPQIKQIIFKIVPNDNTEYVQLRTGDLDVGGVNAAIADEISKSPIPGKHVIVSDANAWYHIDLKQWGFLRETAVRQALDYATPKQALLKGILKGHGQLAYADLDPAFKQYYNPNLPAHPYSLAKAAALLTADGFTKGSGGVLQKNGQPFAIDLWTGTSDDNGQKIAPILKNLWGSIGIKVTLHSQSFTTIFGASGPQFTKNMTGIFYAWFNGNDPDDTYYWASSQIPPSPTGAGGNTVAYFHQFSFQKQIDQLTAAGTATVDTAKRRAVYFQIQDLLATQVPVIFLFWLPGFTVVPSNLQGIQPNPFAHAFWNVAEWRLS
jgi:peptide/nickel transport system substrate-binding protein